MKPTAPSFSTQSLPSLRDDPPRVSVIVPCLNEESHIAACLDSLLANDYPMDRVEILVVDGMSQDGTVKLVQGYTAEHHSVSLIPNPKKMIPAAMNLGIARSTGEVVMKADAHSSYPPEYIRQCIQYLVGQGVHMVGGVLTIAPRSGSLIARSIALALSDRFGSGNASVKVGAAGLHDTDAVAFGCWKREIFDQVGLFDERLGRNSDMEHNKRILAFGGRIVLVPQIKVTYYPEDTMRKFWAHNMADGFWCTYAWKFGKQAASWRHFVPLAFVLLLLSLILGWISGAPWTWVPGLATALYVLLSLTMSLKMSIRARCTCCVAMLPLVYAARHIGRGMGSLYGLLLLVLPHSMTTTLRDRFAR